MKTLIQKELRENLKVAVVGLILAVVVIIGSQLYYLNLIEGIRTGVSTAHDYSYRLQPLTSDNFKVFSRLLCIVVGLALGWFQIQSERHRDLWAFLVHRPMTRTSIFLSKAIAGLLLYALIVGLPLLYFVWWVETPGHVAAPFEWGMAWPVLAGFLSGVAWYFAGMLTGIRQARWYGSRVLGLGAACLAVWDGHGIMSFGCSALFTVALALAVWGAFHNHGRFQGQPVLGKAALTLSLTPGAGGVFVGVIALVAEIFLGLYGVAIWPHYTMSREGVIYKLVERDHTPEILSLDGQPLKDPDTGKPMELDKFNRTDSLIPITTTSSKAGYSVGPQLEWFNLFAADRHTLWFSLNVKQSGRLEGYDVWTRKFIGSFGPDGFAASKEGDGSGFLPHAPGRLNLAGMSYETVRPEASPKTVYEIDIENRSVKPVWTVAGDDTIKVLGLHWQSLYAVVLTRRAIVELSFVDHLARQVWSIPFDGSNQEDSTVDLYEYVNEHKLLYSVWIAPPLLASLGDGIKPPTQVIWLSGKGEITKRESLPALEPGGDPVIGNRILNFLRPPVFQMMPQWLGRYPVPHDVDWRAVRLSFSWAIISVPVGFWLGRRYSFSAKRQAIWGLFNLFFGVPGLLAFIAVQEWPARERCPGCGKLRIVENEKCEHCAAAFPAPKLIGTEIFEA